MSSGWYLPGGVTRSQIPKPSSLELDALAGVIDEPLTVDFVAGLDRGAPPSPDEAGSTLGDTLP
ncbi:hypothetical protein CH295_06230 [Rhodococcus sp. 14-2483-1-2]|nr:hypothetical protein CH295_06230 [Rhodococcus sp. 14-2483-1-2]